MSRKDDINSIFLRKLTPSPGAPPERPPERVRSGAISAMGSSLQDMANSAKAATKLQEQLASGDHVVSLDPSLIDGSMIADRLPIDVDPAFDQLVVSIETKGQQLPILVRPSPTAPGRYQIAYGRRRLRAAVHLQKDISAIVRSMTDDELIVAQGRENLDREDLSFIEKALFAKRLEDGGYDRATIIAALSTDKSDLSRYISIARKIPESLAQKIGPAAKAGRARWLAIADRLEEKGAQSVIEAVVSADDFLARDSDSRFATVFDALSTSRPQSKPKSRKWSTPQGKTAARIEQAATSTSLVFDEKVVPDFAIYVADRLNVLFEEYQSQKRDNGGTAG